MTELSTLERKRLSDLHQIASQLGIEQYRKYRKPELAQMIYKVATEQAAEQAAGRQDGPVQTAPEAPVSNGEAGAPEPREAASAAQAPVMDGFGEADTATVEDATEVEKYRREKGQEQPRQRQERGDRGEELLQTGILDVLPDGFGFLRTNGYSQSKGDVYVSTSQIKRFNLRRGDFVVGQIRPARDGEKYPAMVRIETINGKEPQKGRWRPNFDDLTPLYP
ncbi:MAG: Rho termination factor N-terminal domain-containing protein, partial [Actinobacteria bacterium]|nr:Rho termination factor N-terminal domain-containing protein [Actinomycetota bacterium]